MTQYAVTDAPTASAFALVPAPTATAQPQPAAPAAAANGQRHRPELLVYGGLTLAVISFGLLLLSVYARRRTEDPLLR